MPDPIATSYRCADYDCNGRVEINARGVGTCPECRMVERLGPDGLLEADAEATRAELRSARRDLAAFPAIAPDRGAVAVAPDYRRARCANRARLAELGVRHLPREPQRETAPFGD